jgi:hypothetical protein
MTTITPYLTDELKKHVKDANSVAHAEPYLVETYRKLVEHIAKLSYKNKDYLLFYRGQEEDYRNSQGSSTFYPNIYRGKLTLNERKERFKLLRKASGALLKSFASEGIENYTEVKRRKYVRWSILQHYGVCPTPLLDFTHSLRVACSFATLNHSNEFAYIFVFALPYLTNRISTNSEHELVNIRLLSICPPNAIRPYFQEGYLAGTEDITYNYDKKTKSQLDFKNRLVAKFKIPNNVTFWGGPFDKIPQYLLYPDNDPMHDLCTRIRESIYATP